jgi:hypothetical protein
LPPSISPHIDREVADRIDDIPEAIVDMEAYRPMVGCCHRRYLSISTEGSRIASMTSRKASSIWRHVERGSLDITVDIPLYRPMVDRCHRRYPPISTERSRTASVTPRKPSSRSAHIDRRSFAGIVDIAPCRPSGRGRHRWHRGRHRGYRGISSLGRWTSTSIGPYRIARSGSPSTMFPSQSFPNRAGTFPKWERSTSRHRAAVWLQRCLRRCNAFSVCYSGSEIAGFRAARSFALQAAGRARSSATPENWPRSDSSRRPGKGIRSTIRRRKTRRLQRLAWPHCEDRAFSVPEEPGG